MRLFSSPGLQWKSGKPFCQRRKGFPLTEILFRVIDLKVLNSYSVSEIQEPPAGLGFKITRIEWVSELWCIKQWGQLLFSPISQGMKEGKHLRIKNRNLQNCWVTASCSARGRIGVCIWLGNFGEEFNKSFGNYELFERGAGEDKINNGGTKPYRPVILQRLDLLNM